MNEFSHPRTTGRQTCFPTEGCLLLLHFLSHLRRSIGIQAATESPIIVPSLPTAFPVFGRRGLGRRRAEQRERQRKDYGIPVLDQLEGARDVFELSASTVQICCIASVYRFCTLYCLLNNVLPQQFCNSISDNGRVSIEYWQRYWSIFNRRSVHTARIPLIMWCTPYAFGAHTRVLLRDYVYITVWNPGIV